MSALINCPKPRCVSFSLVGPRMTGHKPNTNKPNTATHTAQVLQMRLKRCAHLLLHATPLNIKPQSMRATPRQESNIGIVKRHVVNRLRWMPVTMDITCQQLAKIHALQSVNNTLTACRTSKLATPEKKDPSAIDLTTLHLHSLGTDTVPTTSNTKKALATADKCNPL